jgi:hypothetical protein
VESILRNSRRALDEFDRNPCEAFIISTPLLLECRA